jgi:hypothetical protein
MGLYRPRTLPLVASAPSSAHLELPADRQVQKLQDAPAAPSHPGEHSGAGQGPKHGPGVDRGAGECLDGQRKAAPSSSLGYEVTENGTPQP